MIFVQIDQTHLKLKLRGCIIICLVFVCAVTKQTQSSSATDTAVLSQSVMH